MATIGPESFYGGGIPLGVLLAALLVDAVFAGIPGLRQVLAAPEAALGAIVSWLDGRLNRDRRTAASRAVRGAVSVVLVAALAFGIGYLLAALARGWPHGWIGETVIVASLLAQRSAFDAARAVARMLKSRGVEVGRATLARSAAYDVSVLDENAVARGAIEGCAERFCDGVVAPAVWYLLLGLPGLFAYRAISVASRLIGHATPHYAAFGAGAAWLDRFANIAPAPIAGLLLIVAAVFVPGANPVRALTTMVRDSRNRGAPAAGWTESAVAGALGLSLAGPRRYRGEVVRGPWIGSGRARATPADITRAVYLFAVACLLAIAIAAVAALAATGWRPLT
jgi:adenosylcobinamide-phosphate synthase